MASPKTNHLDACSVPEMAALRDAFDRVLDPHLYAVPKVSAVLGRDPYDRQCQGHTQR